MPFKLYTSCRNLQDATECQAALSHEQAQWGPGGVLTFRVLILILSAPLYGEMIPANNLLNYTLQFLHSSWKCNPNSRLYAMGK
jgi:hypothetical protein